MVRPPDLLRHDKENIEQHLELGVHVRCGMFNCFRWNN